METTWEEMVPKRPDRYIDWCAQNDLYSSEPEFRWCSVLVQANAKNDDGQLSRGVLLCNLEWLLEQVNQELGKTDHPIRMHNEEKQLLQERFKALDESRITVKDPDDVRFEFFIYLLEIDAYEGGKYKNTKQYKIRLTGPPIQSLRLPSKDFSAIPRMAQNAQVAIGVIDDGLAFAHERFRRRNRKESRIERLWIQEMERFSDTDTVVFGTDYTNVEIGGLLSKFVPKSKPADVPIDDTEVYRKNNFLKLNSAHPSSLVYHQTHGAHVMDLACGLDPESDDKKRPIFAVQLPQPITAETSGITLGSYALQALRQIFNWADSYYYDSARDVFSPIPLVVNFSYGITAGPKDGSLPLVQEIDRLLKERKGRIDTAVVMPAGNGYDSRTTARMCLSKCTEQSIEWIIHPDDKTESYLEIWLKAGEYDPAACPVTIVVTPPLGTAGPSTMPGNGFSQTMLLNNKRVCAVYYDLNEQSNGSQRPRIFIAINRTNSRDIRCDDFGAAPSGRWKITLENTSSERPIETELYIQRDDSLVGFELEGRQSFFDHEAAFERDKKTGAYTSIGKSPITNKGTLNAIGGGEPLLVGAADGSKNCFPTPYTASGPTSLDCGPFASAICEEGKAFPGIYAAGSRSGYKVALQGTSMAAPQLARAIADVGFEMRDLNAEDCEDVYRLRRVLVRGQQFPQRRYPTR